MIVYTLPNTSEMGRGGRCGLGGRQEKMAALNSMLGASVFNLVEVPAGFINDAEERKTGLPRGSMLLNRELVEGLYIKDVVRRQGVRYILHTEPALPQTGAKLKWFDQTWLTDFIAHVMNIIDNFGQLPYAIEVHPGTSQGRRNTFKTLASAIDAMHGAFLSKYRTDVLMFVENRTGQIVQNGLDMQQFWNDLSRDFPSVAKYCGYVLDFSQLFTVTGNGFSSHLAVIPTDSLLGCHVHFRHKEPTVEDEVEGVRLEWDQVARKVDDWKRIASKSQAGDKTLHVLPEVSHYGQIGTTFKFCESVLGLAANEMPAMPNDRPATAHAECAKTTEQTRWGHRHS